MNYLLNSWGLLVLITQVFISLILMGIIIFLSDKVLDKLKLSERLNNFINVVVVIVAIVLSMSCMLLFNIYLNNGKIKEIEISRINNQPCLSVWLSAEYSGKVSVWYVKKLKKFNLDTGKLLEQKIFAIRDSEDMDRTQGYYPRGWIFNKMPGTKAKTLRGSPLLIAPKLVPELNKKVAANSQKVWVIHYSTYLGDYDTYLSYIDSNGQELNRINLRQMFKAKDATALATLTRKNETLVFITRQGYTLIALKANPATGKIMGRIDYYQ